MSRTFIIGTRGSDLALWQARHVQQRLRDLFPAEEIRLEIVQTKGDRIRDGALYKFEDRGFFTKEIEDALLEGRIDLAVHSLKDLPTESPAGLLIAAVPSREDPHDVWLSNDGSGPGEIAAGRRVGTASLRRQAQLRAIRPDLEYVDLRGNVPTRVRKLASGDYDAVVLARAGLARLNLLPEKARVLPFDWMLPAPGQGALGIQVREADAETRERARVLEDPGARLAVTAERSLLARLQGGCSVPVGAFAEPEAGDPHGLAAGDPHRVAAGDPHRLLLRGMVADLSGSPLLRGARAEVCVTEADAALLGRALADELLAAGAGPILERVRALFRRADR